MRTLTFAICALFSRVTLAGSDSSDDDIAWSPFMEMEEEMQAYSKKLYEVPFDPLRSEEDIETIAVYIKEQLEGRSLWVNTGAEGQKAREDKAKAALMASKMPISLDIPMEEQFPEMADTEDEIALLEALKDDSVDASSKGGIQVNYYKSQENKLKKMDIWRRREWNHYQSLIAERDYGEQAKEMYSCVMGAQLYGEYATDRLWIDKNWATNAPGYHLDLASYRKYIVNMPKKDGKPWLLIFMKTAYSYYASEYWNSEINWPKFMCVAKVFDLNIGIMDYNKSEKVYNSFHHYTDGTYGELSPYYMIVKDQHAYHFEKKNYQGVLDALLDAQHMFNGTSSEKGLKDEPVPAPCNGLNIFWQYAKRDIARHYANYLHHIIIGDMMSCRKGTPADHPEECWLYWEFNKYIGETIPKKEKGLWMIKFLVCPLIVVVLLFLRLTCSCLCGTDEEFDEDEDEDDQVKDDTKETAKEKKGKGGKRVKME